MEVKLIDIKVGDKFHYTDRDLWHVVNIFDDKDYKLIVIKSWSKYKQRWVYKVEHLCNLCYLLPITDKEFTNKRIKK